MNNKIRIVSVIFISIIIIPQIALASWWNPFSWNIFNNILNKHKSVTETLRDTGNESISDSSLEQVNLSRDVPESSSEIDKLKKEIGDFKKQKTIKPINNISSIRTTIPDTTKVVEDKPIKDFCPNIDGVQAVFPEGYVFDRESNKCFTEEEFEQREEMRNKESVCLDSKENVVELNKKLINTNETFQKKIDYIKTNPNGALGGGLDNQINVVNQQWSAEQNKIFAEISLAQSEVQLYCQ